MGSSVTVVGSEKKSGVPELKKHAATIHCSNTLSLLQRKISNALLYHAYSELMTTDEHEISIKQLCKLIAYQGNNHAAIKEALKGLLSTVIEWNVVSDTTGTEDWSASSILASVSLRGPICLFAYSPRMKQLLHSPSMFGKINLFIQSHFKSSYGLALYENCIRYRGLPHTKWFEMELFRKLMGVPAEKYPIFRDFKKRVLDKSVEEVNTYSDMIVEAEVHKEGRQVVKIRFSLKERAKKVRLGTQVKEEGSDIEVSEGEESSSNLVQQLVTHYGLTTEQSSQVIDEYGVDFVLEKIAVVEATNSYQQGKIQNVAAYFLSALKNNYQVAKAQKEVLCENEVTVVDLTPLQNAVKKGRKSYLSYREQTIDDALKSLSEAEHEAFHTAFQQYAQSAIQTILRVQRSKYTRDTVMQSPQLKALLRQFALKTLPALSAAMMSFEKFMTDAPEKVRAAWLDLKKLAPEDRLLQSVEC